MTKFTWAEAFFGVTAGFAVYYKRYDVAIVLALLCLQIIGSEIREAIKDAVALLRQH